MRQFPYKVVLARKKSTSLLIMLSRDSIYYSPGEKKIVNVFAQDTCNDDIYGKSTQTQDGSMLGSEINWFIDVFNS